MFKLVDEIEVDWPVRVQKPVDGGRTVEEVFTGRFKIIDQDRTNDVLEAAQMDSNRALMDEVLIGWGEDFGDEHGKPLPFNEQNKRLALRIPYVMTALIRAYFEAASGGPRKN